MENFIKCSNFIGTSFKMLSQEGIHQALWRGMLENWSKWQVV